ncbi:hypothetical protein ACWEQL_32505 [Kitasatospora sp. NPDC004240]
MADIKVVARELRASAGLAHALAEGLDEPVKAALTAATTAAGQLTGWSVAAGVERLGTGWAGPLGGIRTRLADTGTKLETNAAGHERNEHNVAGAWREGVQ